MSTQSIRQISASQEVDTVNSLVRGKRVVFYEELAEYSYLLAHRDTSRGHTVQSAVSYHLHNLTLLSLYFDVILIHTASLFNASDSFVKAVIQQLISTRQFRALLRHKLVTICGWGGRSASEMFGNAARFSQDATETWSIEHVNRLAPIFEPSHLVSRSDTMPDQESTDTFLEAIANSELVSAPRVIERIHRSVAESERRTGHLVAVSFFPALEISTMSDDYQSILRSVFATSWFDHVSSTLPSTTSYPPIINKITVDYHIPGPAGPIHTFLYSPRIFGVFIKGFLTDMQMAILLEQPIAQLVKLRNNGDWKQFCRAYHAAIQQVSLTISAWRVTHQTESRIADWQTWADRIQVHVPGVEQEIDIPTFLTSSISMLQYFISGVPLNPALRLAISAGGQGIRTFFNDLSRIYGSPISPFIRKLKGLLAH